MITLDSFDRGDLKIVYPLVFRFQNEDSKRMKLYVALAFRARVFQFLPPQ